MISGSLSLPAEGSIKTSDAEGDKLHENVDKEDSEASESLLSVLLRSVKRKDRRT